ncbi:lipoprotein 17-related variable surface protein [Metamycoplasma hyosynoviae]|uniref:lipoprotein 17-related variable surface protein n=1 Tax=Metamycoplasma hyosynoviae TaxID=29559 RepID=UPI00235904FE|nr:lipoprotein 17-related variable surface protein [Metamycoplasma hyosynoviae]MDC8916536.1 lipoprotein 17-related variable surface protein [Metamycoplasma hyosynoviae]MDD1360117.1 lipoprotein 17-related variable surface protein [Metamycoplasma hyosynoviae]
MKKLSTLFTLGVTSLLPSISAGMLVSCKDEVIDYRNDIGVNVLKDKSALLASESPKEIKITSKSNKVFYEVNILNIDDETGKMQVKVTPIYKKKVQESFEMTIDGFQKSTKQSEENSTPEEKPKKIFTFWNNRQKFIQLIFNINNYLLLAILYIQDLHPLLYEVK